MLQTTVLANAVVPTDRFFVPLVQVFSHHGCPVPGISAAPAGAEGERLLERWTLRYTNSIGAGSGSGARAGSSDEAAVYKRMVGGAHTSGC